MTSRNRFTTIQNARQPYEREAPPRRTMRHILEPMAIGIICCGLLMIFQPLVKVMYTYSFGVIGIGTLLFIIASHLPE